MFLLRIEFLSPAYGPPSQPRVLPLVNALEIYLNLGLEKLLTKAVTCKADRNLLLLGNKGCCASQQFNICFPNMILVVIQICSTHWSVQDLHCVFPRLQWLQSSEGQNNCSCGTREDVTEPEFDLCPSACSF